MARVEHKMRRGNNLRSSLLTVLEPGFRAWIQSAPARRISVPQVPKRVTLCLATWDSLYPSKFTESPFILRIIKKIPTVFYAHASNYTFVFEKVLGIPKVDPFRFYYEKTNRYIRYKRGKGCIKRRGSVTRPVWSVFGDLSVGLRISDIHTISADKFFSSSSFFFGPKNG